MNENLTEASAEHKAAAIAVARQCINGRLFRIERLELDPFNPPALGQMVDMDRDSRLEGIMDLEARCQVNGVWYAFWLSGQVLCDGHELFFYDGRDRQMADLSEDPTDFLDVSICRLTAENEGTVMYANDCNPSSFFQGHVGWIPLNDILNPSDLATVCRLRNFKKEVRKKLKAIEVLHPWLKHNLYR